jgi:hypothetical protein
MKPPSDQATLPAFGPATGIGVTRPSGRRWIPATIGPAARLATVAATVLVGALGLALYVAERPGAGGPAAPASAVPGTAFLGSATCADWQAAGATRRLTIVGTLAAAATQPDPENQGATLSQGATYGLFERVCATAASRSMLLYESYNRAASMSAARGVGMSSGWTATPHP